MGNFFMKKDQTGGRRMKIWQRPRLFTYFFAPFPYFCLFIFRCLLSKYKNEYEIRNTWLPMIRTGKCVTEDMFCKQKSRELKTAEAAASTALDEYKEGRRKMDVLNQKLPKSGNFLEIVEKHGDDIKKWEKLKTKTDQLKRKFEFIQKHAHSLSKTVKECKSKN